MKLKKEELIAEVERLKKQLSADDDRDANLRTQIGNMLKAGKEMFDSPYSRSRGEIFSWLEITCEIGKLLEKASKFDQTQEVENIKKHLSYLQDEFEKQKEKNENRN